MVCEREAETSNVEAMIVLHWQTYKHVRSVNMAIYVLNLIREWKSMRLGNCKGLFDHYLFINLLFCFIIYLLVFLFYYLLFCLGSHSESRLECKNLILYWFDEFYSETWYIIEYKEYTHYLQLHLDIMCYSLKNTKALYNYLTTT